MKLLVIDDEAEYRDYLGGLLRDWGHEVREATNGEEAIEALDHFSPDVMVSDLMMPKMDGFELLRQLRGEGRLPPTILLTAFGSLEAAIRTIHDLGGFWFLEKPVEAEALRVLVNRAGAQRRLEAENEELRRQLTYRGVMGTMVGKSRPMLEVFSLIQQVSPTSAAVLITGESGTGKELVARAIHSHSRRSSGPFLAVNCAALPETLIESELFGHEKGAFTGAVERRAGALEAAAGGTLFLDELGEMPIGMQAKLLRVLEDLKFRRLGGKQELTADVRVLAATNVEPLKAIKEGKLREDLYYRLNVFQLQLPPLRDRKEDIPAIVEAMIHTFNHKHQTRVAGATPEFLQVLHQRSWEGNVRELRNVVERSMIVAAEGMLTPAHVLVGTSARAKEPVMAALDSARNGNHLPIEVGMTVDEGERVLIEATLQEKANNKTRAAAVLGISAKTLHMKLKQYALEDGSVMMLEVDEA